MTSTTSTTLVIHPTPFGETKRLEHPNLRQPAVLHSDGQVEKQIFDQVVLDGQHHRDFQESLETAAVRRMLSSLKETLPEEPSREELTSLARSNLGETWSCAGHAHSTEFNTYTFGSGVQSLVVGGRETNDTVTSSDFSAALSTHSPATDGAYWDHGIFCSLDQDFEPLRATVQEYAILESSTGL